MRVTGINTEINREIRRTFATHLPKLCDPLLGRDPQFGKRCSKRHGYFYLKLKLVKDREAEKFEKLFKLSFVAA